MKVTAFAPASVANVAVGFDLLGFAVSVAGDRVSVEKTARREITIGEIRGADQALPKDPAKNTATAGLLRLLHDRQLDFGFHVEIEKGIAFGSGMGGSAASAVAAIVAASALLPTPLSESEMLSYALVGEAQASGSYHADNLAPSLCGGLTLARVRPVSGNELPKVEVQSIPCPADIHCVLLHPELSVETRQARGILKSEISLLAHIAQSANLAGLLIGCFRGDLECIRRSLEDVIVEPQRAHLIPGFGAVKKAALAHGALGCSISGAGPSVFAWAESLRSAQEIEVAMNREFRAAGVTCSSWSVPLKSEGARIL